MNRPETRSRRMRVCRAVGIVCALAGLLGLLAVTPDLAAAQTLSVAETETLVRSIYFEGFPEEEARLIGPDGAARLVEMLADPEESAAHANVLLALGICGEPVALGAIRNWADQTQAREGEIDRNTFRAWQALPFALGHLAEHDRRAVKRLEAGLSEAAPSWTFRHHRGARLHRMNRRAAARALGNTGLPAARIALDRADQNATDPEFAEDLRRAREAHSRRAQGGAQ